MATDQLQEPRFLGAPRSLLNKLPGRTSRVSTAAKVLPCPFSEITAIQKFSSSFACRRCDSSPRQRRSHGLCHRPKCPHHCGSRRRGKICSAFETSLTTVLLYPMTTNTKLKN
ncbi:hypothetical protein WG66_003138, partial [Moniliophthora roreri]